MKEVNEPTLRSVLPNFRELYGEPCSAEFLCGGPQVSRYD